ncbi:MAG: S1 RNA-binding domain-containing protein [Mycoplasmataceae bacterium]|nr:S1 RNA-binding domain-containing protein [Mycoplasmataceae bacterium]
MEVGSIVHSNVVSINKSYLLVNIDDEFTGMVHISNISDYYIVDINYMFLVGEQYDFLVEEIDYKSKKVKLSWKALNPRFMKRAFKYCIEETESGFKNLLEKTLKEVEND